MKDKVVRYGAVPKEPYKEGETSKFRSFMGWLFPWLQKKGVLADRASNARLERETAQTEKIQAEKLKIEAEARKIQLETTALAIEKEIQLRKEFSQLMNQETEIRKHQGQNFEDASAEIVNDKIAELDGTLEDLIKVLRAYGGEIKEIFVKEINEGNPKIEEEKKSD